jgi:CHASE2 domain-containing sensor protein
MKNIKQIIFIFIAFKITVLLAFFIYEHLPLQLLHFEHLATEDVQFNDIYYSSNLNINLENKDVVLINTGSVAKDDSFRTQLANLINKVSTFKPKKVGLDFVFEEPKVNDTVLQNAITKNNIVLGSDFRGSFKNIFTSTNKGIVNFPVKEGETIREYYNFVEKNDNKIPSFAAVLTGVNRDNSLEYLKYTSDSKGFYNVLDKNQKSEILNFPAIEALAILNDIESDKIKKLLKNKIVIIGHLGNGDMDNKFDVEDKHRVPNNRSLFNRNLTMPGCVIHANAVQMMIDKNEMFLIESWLYELISNIILFGFLFLFYTIHHKYYLGKLINISIILGSTIPIIFFFCIYLMNLNIYYKIGGLFMQIAFLEEFIGIADGVKNKFNKNK